MFMPWFGQCENWATLSTQGNHYLRLRNPNQPQTRLVDSNLDKDLFLDEFIWVLGGWEFRARNDGL